MTIDQHSWNSKLMNWCSFWVKLKRFIFESKNKTFFPIIPAASHYIKYESDKYKHITTMPGSSTKKRKIKKDVKIWSKFKLSKKRKTATVEEIEEFFTVTTPASSSSDLTSVSLTSSSSFSSSCSFPGSSTSSSLNSQLSPRQAQSPNSSSLSPSLSFPSTLPSSPISSDFPTSLGIDPEEQLKIEREIEQQRAREKHGYTNEPENACPICGKNLNFLDNSARQRHVNKCLDKSKNINGGSKTKQISENCCVLCGLNLKKISQQRHLLRDCKFSPANNTNNNNNNNTSTAQGRNNRQHKHVVTAPKVHSGDVLGGTEECTETETNSLGVGDQDAQGHDLHLAPMERRHYVCAMYTHPSLSLSLSLSLLPLYPLYIFLFELYAYSIMIIMNIGVILI